MRFLKYLIVLLIAWVPLAALVVKSGIHNSDNVYDESIVDFSFVNRSNFYYTINFPKVLKVIKNKNRINNYEYMIDSIKNYNMEGDISYCFYEYDERGNTLSWKWIDLYNNVWHNHYLNYYQYNEKNQMIKRIWESWRKDTLSVKNIFINTYDSSGKKLSTLTEIWNKGKLTDLDSTYYEYNEKGLLGAELLFKWFDNMWNGGLYCKYNYDDKGNLLEKLYDDRKYTYNYDSTGNRIQFIEEHWDDSVWVNSTKWIYEYNEKNQLLYEEMDYWNIPMHEWYNWLKYSYIYNEENKKIEKLIEIENSPYSDWVNYSRNTYFYDDKGLLRYELMDEWNNGEWIPQTNNQTSFYLDDITPFFDGMTGYKLEIFYNPSVSVSDGKKIELVNLEINPNPAENALNLDFSVLKYCPVSISISNSLGMKIAEVMGQKYHSEGTYRETFDASALPSGIYFCTLQTPECTLTRQFVVVR